MTDCRSDPREEIGDGVIIERRYLDGQLAGVWYEHPSTVSATGRCSGYAPVRPHAKDGWDVVQVQPLTLSPSLVCRACGHHGFIREGRWVPC